MKGIGSVEGGGLLLDFTQTLKEDFYLQMT